MTYFLTGNPQYHRRGVVSRPCSGWEGVGPTRYGCQEFCKCTSPRCLLMHEGGMEGFFQMGFALHPLGWTGVTPKAESERTQAPVHLEIVRVAKDGKRRSRLTRIPVAVHDDPAANDGPWFLERLSKGRYALTTHYDAWSFMSPVTIDKSRRRVRLEEKARGPSSPERLPTPPCERCSRFPRRDPRREPASRKSTNRTHSPPSMSPSGWGAFHRCCTGKSRGSS